MCWHYAATRPDSPPLVKQTNSVSTSPTHLSPQTSPRVLSNTSSPPKSSNTLQALALYDFTANEPSELSFVKGDVLTLLNAKVIWKYFLHLIMYWLNTFLRDRGGLQNWKAIEEKFQAITFSCVLELSRVFIFRVQSQPANIECKY